MDRRKITLGHLSAILTIFIWGTTFISIKVLLGLFTPVEIMFFRMVLAYVALLIARPQFIPMCSLKEELLFAGAGLCGVTLYFIFQNVALSYTLASNVGVLVSVSPFITALLSHFFLKDEELRVNFFIGFAISIVGIILIGFNGNFILKLNPLGDLLAILAAVVWAFYSVLIRKISALNHNTILSTRRIFFYGLLFMLPALGLFEFRLGLERFASITNILHFLFLGVGASALCFVTWNYALSVLGAMKTSVYIYAIPVVTVIASLIFLREPITLVALGGVLLILLGLFVSERRTRPVEAQETA